MLLTLKRLDPERLATFIMAIMFVLHKSSGFVIHSI